MALHVAGAEASVVSLQCPDDIMKREPVALQCGGLGQHVVLLYVAANRVDISDIGYGAQLWADNPVLHGAQIGKFLHAVGEVLACGC